MGVLLFSWHAEAMWGSGLPRVVLGMVVGQNGDSPRARQRRHFAKAQALYLSGRFKEALSEYQKALAARFHPVIVFNIGQCYRHLHQWKKALFSYRLYLSKRPNAPNRAEVEKWIHLLEKQEARRESAQHRGRLSLVTQPPGAEIRVDDPNAQAVGRTPLVVTLSVGPHVVFLDFGGGILVQRVVQIRPQAIVSMTVSAAVRKRATGQVTVIAEPSGSAVRVDSPTASSAGLTPLTLTLTVGQHILYVDSPGMPQRQRLVTVQPGRVVVVRVTQSVPEMGNLAPGVSGSSGENQGWKPAPPRSVKSPWWLTLSWSVAAASFVAGTVTGILTFSKYESWKDSKTDSEYLQLKRLGLATGVLLGTSVVTGLTAIIGHLVLRRLAANKRKHVWLAPSCNGSGCAVFAGGRF